MISKAFLKERWGKEDKPGKKEKEECFKRAETIWRNDNECVRGRNEGTGWEGSGGIWYKEKKMLKRF